jgi:hypothetical protein
MYLVGTALRGLRGGGVTTDLRSNGGIGDAFVQLAGAVRDAFVVLRFNKRVSKQLQRSCIKVYQPRTRDRYPNRRRRRLWQGLHGRTWLELDGWWLVVGGWWLVGCWMMEGMRDPKAGQASPQCSTARLSSAKFIPVSGRV